MGVRPGFVLIGMLGLELYSAVIITNILVMNILIESNLLSSGELYNAVLSKHSLARSSRGVVAS